MTALTSSQTSPVTADFGFNDEQRDKYLGGYIAAAFYMVGAPAALLFGYLSDTVNRRNLLFVAVLLGEWGNAEAVLYGAVWGKRPIMAGASVHSCILLCGF
jgi:MFS family permease